MNTIDIEKIFAEVGKLHIQVLVLQEENARLQAALKPAEAVAPSKE